MQTNERRLGQEGPRGWNRLRWRGVNATAVIVGLAACPLGCTGDVGQEPIDETPSPLTGGVYAAVRPEIGMLSLDGYVCTGTLVDPRWVLTAAHCVGYEDVSVSGSFTMTRSDGHNVVYGIDRTFSLGRGDSNDRASGLGGGDVALVRLSSSATSKLLAAPVPPSDAIPAQISEIWPPSGSPVTVFGYGCQARSSSSTSKFAKQYESIVAGPPSRVSCKGDSGGPFVMGTPDADGSVFGVISGYNAAGADLVGDAVTNGLPGLRGVSTWSNSTVTSFEYSDFATWASQPNVTPVVGDFDGDGLSDIALVGGRGWDSVPIAFSIGGGRFRIANQKSPELAAWAAAPGAQPVAGHFHRGDDARSDLALIGGWGWHTFVVVPSMPKGTFAEPRVITSESLARSAQWYGARARAGDFDGDGISDIALVGSPFFDSVPIAFGRADGGFDVIEIASPDFARWAAHASTNARVGAGGVVAADFDDDGRTDIVLAGGPGWTSIAMASLIGRTGFTITNLDARAFSTWAQDAKELVVGDFNGDGHADLALTGRDWVTIGVALYMPSAPRGTFESAMLPIARFPGWATVSRTTVAGRFDRAGFDAVAVVGGDLATIPVAFFAK